VVKDLLIFDMDGVLVEVTDSYRAAVIECVHHFTGQRVSYELIQDYKNEGGWNNDWDLSQKIAADLGVPVPHSTIVAKFNEFFLGDNGNGLIMRERWFPRPGLLERLADWFQLGLFTGSLKYEADISLTRFAPALTFDPMICAEHVADAKPSPEGLQLIAARFPGRKRLYVGDTVDDARSAAAAGVPFIGVAAASHSRRDEVLALFANENAVAVIESINEIESVL
jgi:HAD superfamily phosphatase